MITAALAPQIAMETFALSTGVREELGKARAFALSEAPALPTRAPPRSKEKNRSFSGASWLGDPQHLSPLIAALKPRLFYHE